MAGLYKEEMVTIFQDTMKKLQPYNTDTVDSIKNSVLYDVDDRRYISSPKGKHKTKVTVVKGTTVEYGLKVSHKHKGDKVAILNFASAKHPGGMVIKGSVAQEECICRCSNLYSVLSDAKFSKQYYEYHKFSHNKIYTSKLIYSPDIIFIKDDSKDYADLKHPVKMDVITCAAPNLRGLNGKVDMSIVRNNNMSDIYYERISNIFKAAYTNGVDHLILGAFGCGVFKNNPNDIARAFHEVQDEFHGCFKSITYAIYCGTDKSSVNFDVFRTEFK
jgi:uncharacterized protein (TIGR02452 family)